MRLWTCCLDLHSGCGSLPDEMGRRRRILVVTAAVLSLAAGGAWLSADRRVASGLPELAPVVPSRDRPRSEEAVEEVKEWLSPYQEMNLPRTLAAYDALAGQVADGGLSRRRSGFLDDVLNAGTLDTPEFCKLLDHALPDLLVNGEMETPPDSRITQVLDLAYSGREGGGKSDRAAVEEVMAWLLDLRNPAMQCSLLGGAGQWYGKRFSEADAMEIMRRIGTAGARDHFAAGYLSEALEQSSRPLEEYLDYAMLVGKGTCVGEAARALPDDTNYSELPELMLKRSSPPEPAVMAGLLTLWYSRKPDDAAAFTGNVPEPLRESLALAVAAMVASSTPQAVDLVEQMPAGEEKDRWLSDALFNSSYYSESNARKLAGQITDPQKRDKAIEDLRKKWEKPDYFGR